MEEWLQFPSPQNISAGLGREQTRSDANTTEANCEGSKRKCSNIKSKLLRIQLKSFLLLLWDLN